MKPLIVLIVSFAISCLAFYAAQHDPHIILSGRIAMALMLLFTSVAHFAFFKGMLMTVPPFIPFKNFMVYFTGVLEVAAAVGLMFTATHYITGLMLILFFIALIPSNIYTAQNHINLEKADYTGKGLSYLWFRIPLQLFFIGWVVYFAVLN
ncbi:DoxX family protein [Mucilaginibacter antarcticus]|uniref:DoxX-like protein n=1 Tax=Mucilaginibacter antarcticus TaxID=1855725 RepID=A0ABW5XRR4_9SPHI